MEDQTPAVSKQPSINAPGYNLPPPSSQLSSSFELPFQFQATTFGAAETAAQVSLSSSTVISTIAKNFRHAKLIQCHAIITPTYLAIANPITINLVWVPDSSTAKPSEILNVYGGTSFTFGGAFCSTKSIIVPLPMNSVNLMLKDSALYTDGPKLLAYSPAPATPSKSPVATIQISGKILLSSPLLQAS
ncbi:coat protein [Andean potato mild mosaic virus]|uniref:Capsid protein n=2 Tax=Tymovirus TaxID=12148 RepID=R4L0F1_9VIRU|nr:coat protein [Andean potato mild mosaic virus]AGG15962.1 coat protein [Andean potato mild mosaic virus]AGL11972.1 coat protein [Andean potato latent virus]AGL11973.1 coat protein [Andean potato latent virus]